MILWIHHWQEVWEDDIAGGLRNGRFGELLDDWLEENEPDDVIITLFEEWELGEYHRSSRLLRQYCPRVHEFGYGWHRDMFYHGEDLIEGTHSQVIPIEDWARSLAGKTVHLCGAFDGECLSDARLILDHVGATRFDIHQLIS